MRLRLVFGLTASVALVAPVARARSSFEPTDLELEDPGVLDIDLQVGTYRGTPRRAVALDFEIDLGLLPNLELGVDGTVSRLGPDVGGIHPLRTTLDPIWVSVKMGLVDLRAQKTGRAWAFGIQLGPRLPLMATTGLGYEALVLLGRQQPPLCVVLQAGLLADPRATDGSRPVALEAGLDLTWMLSATWAVIGELSAMRYQSADPHEMVATAGLARTTQSLDVHVIGFAGFFGATDRLGVLVGISPKVRLF